MRNMHTVCIGLPLLFGIVGLSLQMYNPIANIGFLACFITPYPPDCDLMEDVECTRGGDNTRVFLLIASLVPLLSTVIILLGEAFCIWWTVHQQQRHSSRHSQYNIYNTSRQVAIQSLIYGVVFFNTFVWMAIDPISDMLFPRNGITNFKVAVRFLAGLFYPSQGFFNFLVYIRPRYMRIRRRRHDMSMWWAFRETIVGEKLNSSRYHPVGTASNDSHRNSTSNFLEISFRSFRHITPQNQPSSTRKPIQAHSGSEDSKLRSSQGELVIVPSSFSATSSDDGAGKSMLVTAPEERAKAELMEDDDDKDNLGDASNEEKR